MFAPLSRQLRLLHLVTRTIYMEHFCDLFDPARARLWSALETLTLQVLGFTDHPINWPGINQAVPLSSLLMLAASCPRLHTLELYVYYPLCPGGRENEDLENRIHSSQLMDHKLTNLKIIFSDPSVTTGDIVDAVTTHCITIYRPRFPERPECQHFWQVGQHWEGMGLWNQGYDEGLQGRQRKQEPKENPGCHTKSTPLSMDDGPMAIY